jgi:hypothetical protein
MCVAVLACTFAAPRAAAQSELAIDQAWNRDNITIVAFVQESRSRRIVAASAVPLESARR